MSITRLLLVISVLILVTLLFRKASGSLAFTNMNMISAIYYYIMAFNLVGASLIYLGFQKHYLVQKIVFPDTIDKTYYALSYSLIMLPLVLIAMKKIMGRFLQQRDTCSFLKTGSFLNPDMINIQGVILLLVAVCTAATAYVFLNLGYNPIVSVIYGEDLNVLRQSGNRFFSGNQYIKNLFMSTLTPMVSYITYIYYRTTHTKKWLLLFIYMAALSVLVLTYDFSKAPIITYIFGLYLLEVAMGNAYNNKRFFFLVLSAVVIVLFFYVVVFNVRSSLFSIYTGPLGRILFTQIATLFLHIEAFPQLHPFMEGASFNSWMSFFIPAANGMRSGRVVMTIYNPTGIETNTAGVMNTVFIGEAYANFGVFGIIIAPIVFGVIIGFFAYLVPCLKKTPATILFYVEMTLHFVAIVEGGFVDILYSASFFFIFLFAIFVLAISGQQRKYYMSKIETQIIYDLATSRRN